MTYQGNRFIRCDATEVGEKSHRHFQHPMATHCHEPVLATRPDYRNSCTLIRHGDEGIGAGESSEKPGSMSRPYVYDESSGCIFELHSEGDQVEERKIGQK